MTDDNDAAAPELDDGEHAALATWDVAGPPAGFADRVTAPAIPLAPAPARRTTAGRWITAAAVCAVLALGAGLSYLATGGDPPAGPSAGAVTTADRTTVAIGARAVVVAEGGAVLAWTVDGTGGARVQHGAGAGFYRVDHGRPFVVATPLGEVTVTGTCFRIEVIMKPSKQSVISGAIGATLAAAVVVTVYEGGVVVAGTHGSSQVRAGERATLTADGTPTVATGAGPDVAPPAAEATRDQLLARDELQRQRIAGLTARVGELERVIAEHGGDGGRPGGLDRLDESWLDPSAEQLAAWAKTCKVRFDIPPISGGEATHYGPERAADYGLREDEIEPVNTVMAALHRKWADQVRAIYVDVVGDDAADPALSAQAMMQEIEDKSPAGEQQAIQARIAQERAGLIAPPADWSHAPPIERLMRGLAGLGDEAEKAFAKAIGADRAHALRASQGGWPAKMEMSGCKDDPSR